MKRIGLAFLSFVLFLLFACNQQPAGTHITVLGATTGAVYYQVGKGEWRLLPREDYGRYGFDLPAGENRYGVVLLCRSGWYSSTEGTLQIYQLTTDDATELRLDCGPDADRSLSSVALAVSKAQGDPGNYDRATATLGSGHGFAPLGRPMGLYARPEAGQGLMVWAEDKSPPYALLRLRYDPDFDARPGRCPYDQPCTVELGPSDAVRYQNVAALSAPAWASRGGFEVGFLAHGWTWFPFTDGGGLNGGRYFEVPGVVPGDLYLSRAWAGDASGTHWVGQTKTFGPQTGTLRFTLPQDEFDPTVSQGALPTFAGLDYPEAPAAYRFRLSVGARGTLFHSLYEYILVSPRWLGTSSRYAAPDVSGAPGLAGTRPLPGDEIAWSAAVLLSDRTLSELLTAERVPPYGALSEHTHFRVPGFSLRSAVKYGRYTAP